MAVSIALSFSRSGLMGGQRGERSGEGIPLRRTGRWRLPSLPIYGWAYGSSVTQRSQIRHQLDALQIGFLKSTITSARGGRGHAGRSRTEYPHPTHAAAGTQAHGEASARST